MPAPAPSTVLILGATGRLGSAAARAFADAGWRVLAQSRQAPAALPVGAEHVAVPIEDTGALAARAVGARVVLHAVNPPYPRWSRDAMPLLRAGAEVAQRLDARLLFPGNVYGFGERMPPRLREDTPQAPTTRKGRIRCAMEDELAARATRGLRVTVLRAGDFIGGGAGGWLDLVIAKSLTRGRLAYPGPMDVPHAWAYLPDLARAFVALASADGLAEFARLHFAGHTLTGTRLLDALERAAARLGLGRVGGLRRGGVPWPLLRLAGLASPMLREVVEMAYLWRVPHALDGAALRSAVGTLPVTPIDEALESALVDLGFGQAQFTTCASSPLA